MNDKKENNNETNIEEAKKKKFLNTNKKLFNKNSIRKQKRLFQMQKRLALLNEEELSDLEYDKNNEKSNNLKSLQKIIENKKQNRNSLSFNCSLNHKDNINKEIDIQNNENENRKKKTFINLENIFENKKEDKELRNEENKKNENKKENNINKEENKEEEFSLKKKNTNSNTNDEGSEVILYSEFEQNRKKSINQNDSIDAVPFTKIINEDIDENINIFSRNNQNNINEEKEVINEKFNCKEYSSMQILNNNSNQDNFLNNFNFFNIIVNDCDENITKNDNDIEIKDVENIQNTSVIINENYNENNITVENNENKNNEEENVELNISNLEIDINQINNDNNYIQNEDELVMSGANSNEFAKRYLSSKSKSFIKFNNNLTARVAAHSLKNSPSYMLALCPELLDVFDKKNLIRDNYAVTDVISEEMDSETFTPRPSEKIGHSLNKNTTIDFNQSINNSECPVNNTLRNKEITNSANFGFFHDNKEKKVKINPKFYNKNNKNRIKEIKDIDIQLKHFNDNKKKKDNTKSYPALTKEINTKVNTNNNHKSGILKNSDKKLNDNLKIKIKHQKAKSLINNNQINSLNLNESSPKHVTFKLFNNQNSSSKGILKNSGYKKMLFNKNKLEKEDLKYKNYFSNENSSSNNSLNTNKINHRKSNSKGILINNLKLCKSDKRKRIFDSKIQYNNLKKKNVQILSRSNQYKNNHVNSNEKKKSICYTEKNNNKSKNYLTFISHMKKNTPINLNNITEQNINHSKKLSQQISEGYKFFMNSLNTQNINYKNRIKEINKINLGFNLTPLSKYFTFNKNKLIHSNNNYNNSVTFIKKNIVKKDDKNLNAISIHNKSKTSFIYPSYLNINKSKLFNKNNGLVNNKSYNKKRNNEKINKNIKKYIKKNNNKFNEIKKVVKDSSIKVYHKKINTIGNSKELTKLINNNLAIGFNKQLKSSTSNNNLRKNFNKHKIIMALQHIKFLPNENYSKALNELYKSKKNLFIILVYTDSIQRYIFRGLYEINSTDHKTANKMFAPGYSQNTININSLNLFFNYQSNNGEFVKTKFKNENEKKFGADTIIAY